MANMASACALVVSEEKSFDPVRSWSTKTAATTCAFVTISVISICTMVVCGVFIVREYALSESYKRNHCWVEDINYSEVKDCTFCHGHKTKEKNGASCIQSKFPCVRVTVAYEVDREKREGLLHSSSIEATGLLNECSYQVCLRDYEASKKAVGQYVEKWNALMVRHLKHHSKDDDDDDVNTGLLDLLRHLLESKQADNGTDPAEGPSNLTAMIQRLKDMQGRAKNSAHRHLDAANGYFRCFVNEEDPHDVIEHKTYTKSDVVHCMLWPSLIVFGCCCAFLYVEASRRGLTFCGQREKLRPGTHHHHHHNHNDDGKSSFPGGRSFLPSGKVLVLDRSHFAQRGLDDHAVKSGKTKDVEAYVKKQTNRTYPVKSRLLRDPHANHREEEEGISHVTKGGRGHRPEVDGKSSSVQT